jgi:Ca2+-binding RTX toxin-like protein
MPGKGNGGGGGGGKPKEDGPLSLNGNKKDNTLIGGDFDDNIWGRDGDDTLFGRGGNDRLVGGNGNDTLYGEDGDDRLHGGDGDDELFGGAGSDMLQGGDGADVMDGGLGPEDTSSVEGTDDHDVASFVEIAPTLDTDTDLYTVGLIFQKYTGVDGFDYETSAGDTIVRVEEIRGTNYDDIMIGRDDGDSTNDSDNDYYVGARGEDALIGNGGNDTLYGSLDDDVIYAGSAVLNDQNSIVSSSSDNESDTLVFLRYNTDGLEGDDPWALGDGHDVVYNFDVGNVDGHDTILFLVNEEFEPLIGGDYTGTLITYAADSSILLEGVDFADAAGMIDIQFEMITL